MKKNYNLKDFSFPRCFLSFRERNNWWIWLRVFAFKYFQSNWLRPSVLLAFGSDLQSVTNGQKSIVIFLKADGSFINLWHLLKIKHQSFTLIYSEVLVLFTYLYMVKKLWEKQTKAQAISLNFFLDSQSTYIVISLITVIIHFYCLKQSVQLDIFA